MPSPRTGSERTTAAAEARRLLSSADESKLSDARVEVTRVWRARDDESARTRLMAIEDPETRELALALHSRLAEQSVRVAISCVDPEEYCFNLAGEWLRTLLPQADHEALISLGYDNQVERQWKGLKAAARAYHALTEQDLQHQFRRALSMDAAAAEYLMLGLQTTTPVDSVDDTSERLIRSRHGARTRGAGRPRVRRVRRTACRSGDSGDDGPGEPAPLAGGDSRPTAPLRTAIA
jgi:hypothetical protein